MKKLFYILLSVICVACSPSLPSGVLSEDDMVDLLYDMHVAQALYDKEEVHSYESDIIALRASVLEKNGIDQAEWDSSYNYYCRNADKLHAVYVRLSERMSNDLIAAGGKVDGVMDEAADTTNIWHGDNSFVLMQQPPYNRISYSIDADSLVNDGDRLTLQFDVQLIFQDGYRDIVAIMAVYYEGKNADGEACDSILTKVTHVNSDSHGVITVNNDVDRLHVKKICGYFVMGQSLTSVSSDTNTSTLRLASVRNIKLLHTATQPAAVNKQVTAKDSVNVDSTRQDSVKLLTPQPAGATNNQIHKGPVLITK